LAAILDSRAALLLGLREHHDAVLPNMRCVPMRTFNSKSRRKDSGRRGSTEAATNGLNRLDQGREFLENRKQAIT
jgi:hypothetical protein